MPHSQCRAKILTTHCPLQCGGVLKGTHCPLRCAMQPCTGGPLLTAPYSAAVYQRIPIGHCPVHCSGVPKKAHCPLQCHSAEEAYCPMQCGSVLKKAHRPMQCTEGGPVPTAPAVLLKEGHSPLPLQCDSVPIKTHCPLPPAVKLCFVEEPLPTAPYSAPVYKRWHAAPSPCSAAVHPLPPTVRQCAERDPLPTTPCSVVVCRRRPTAHCPVQCGSVEKNTYCPCPLHCGRVLLKAHCLLPLAMRHCTEGYPLPTTPCSAAVCRNRPTVDPPPPGSVQKDLHYPVGTATTLYYPLPTAVRCCTRIYTAHPPPHGAALCRTTNTAHCPLQCGSVLKGLHCSLPTTVGQRRVGSTTAHCP